LQADLQLIFACEGCRHLLITPLPQQLIAYRDVVAFVDTCALSPAIRYHTLSYHALRPHWVTSFQLATGHSPCRDRFHHAYVPGQGLAHNFRLTSHSTVFRVGRQWIQDERVPGWL